MSDVTVDTAIVKLADINPAAYNPRVELSEKDFEFRALKSSLKEFSCVVPLVINRRTNTLVSGHQRLNALKANGETETEVLYIDVPEAQEKALCIALNKISGKFDFGKLADIIEELRNANYDTECAGFSKADVAELLGELKDEIPDFEVESVGKKEDTVEGVRCVVGEYEFRVDEYAFEDMIADVREKVGFSTEKVQAEMKRRLLR